MEKNINKNVCMTGLLCCTAEIGTKLLINDTSIKNFFNKKDIARRKKNKD